MYIGPVHEKTTERSFVRNSNGGLSGIQMAFEKGAIWHPTSFRSFKKYSFWSIKFFGFDRIETAFIIHFDQSKQAFFVHFDKSKQFVTQICPSLNGTKYINFNSPAGSRLYQEWLFLGPEQLLRTKLPASQCLTRIILVGPDCLERKQDRIRPVFRSQLY